MPYKFTKLSAWNVVTSVNNYVFKKLSHRPAAGLYDADDNLIASWDVLVNTYGLNIEIDSNTNNVPNSMYYVLSKNSEFTNVVKLVIPDTVEHIGSFTVFGISRLRHIIIGANVASIEDAAFGECSRMQYYDFTSCRSIPTITTGNSVFSGMPDDCEIRVPASLVDEWKSTGRWTDVADHIVGV